MKEESMFYIILRDDDLRLKRHTTKKEAVYEAARLADLHWPFTFFVLKAKYKVSRAIPDAPPPPPPPPPAQVECLHRFTSGGEY